MKTLSNYLLTLMVALSLGYSLIAVAAKHPQAYFFQACDVEIQGGMAEGLNFFAATDKQFKDSDPNSELNGIVMCDGNSTY